MHDIFYWPGVLSREFLIFSDVYDKWTLDESSSSYLRIYTTRDTFQNFVWHSPKGRAILKQFSNITRSVNP